MVTLSTGRKITLPGSGPVVPDVPEKEKEETGVITLSTGRKINVPVSQPPVTEGAAPPSQPTQVEQVEWWKPNRAQVAEDWMQGLGMGTVIKPLSDDPSIFGQTVHAVADAARHIAGRNTLDLNTRNAIEAGTFGDPDKDKYLLSRGYSPASIASMTPEQKDRELKAFGANQFFDQMRGGKPIDYKAATELNPMQQAHREFIDNTFKDPDQRVNKFLRWGERKLRDLVPQRELTEDDPMAMKVGLGVMRNLVTMTIDNAPEMIARKFMGPVAALAMAAYSVGKQAGTEGSQVYDQVLTSFDKHKDALTKALNVESKNQLLLSVSNIAQALLKNNYMTDVVVGFLKKVPTLAKDAASMALDAFIEMVEELTQTHIESSETGREVTGDEWITTAITSLVASGVMDASQRAWVNRGMRQKGISTLGDISTSYFENLITEHISGNPMRTAKYDVLNDPLYSSMRKKALEAYRITEDLLKSTDEKDIRKRFYMMNYHMKITSDNEKEREDLAAQRVLDRAQLEHMLEVNENRRDDGQLPFPTGRTANMTDLNRPAADLARALTPKDVDLRDLPNGRSLSPQVNGVSREQFIADLRAAEAKGQAIDEGAGAAFEDERKGPIILHNVASDQNTPVPTGNRGVITPSVIDNAELNKDRKDVPGGFVTQIFMDQKEANEHEAYANAARGARGDMPGVMEDSPFGAAEPRTPTGLPAETGGIDIAGHTLDNVSIEDVIWYGLLADKKTLELIKDDPNFNNVMTEAAQEYLNLWKSPKMKNENARRVELAYFFNDLYNKLGLEKNKVNRFQFIKQHENANLMNGWNSLRSMVYNSYVDGVKSEFDQLATRYSRKPDPETLKDLDAARKKLAVVTALKTRVDDSELPPASRAETAARRFLGKPTDDGQTVFDDDIPTNAPEDFGEYGDDVRSKEGQEYVGEAPPWILAIRWFDQEHLDKGYIEMNDELNRARGGLDGTEETIPLDTRYSNELKLLARADEVSWKRAEKSSISRKTEDILKARSVKLLNRLENTVSFLKFKRDPAIFQRMEQEFSSMLRMEYEKGSIVDEKSLIKESDAISNKISRNNGLDPFVGRLVSARVLDAMSMDKFPSENWVSRNAGKYLRGTPKTEYGKLIARKLNLENKISDAETAIDRITKNPQEYNLHGPQTEYLLHHYSRILSESDLSLGKVNRDLADASNIGKNLEYITTDAKITWENRGAIKGLSKDELGDVIGRLYADGNTVDANRIQRIYYSDNEARYSAAMLAELENRIVQNADLGKFRDLSVKEQADLLGVMESMYDPKDPKGFNVRMARRLDRYLNQAHFVFEDVKLMKQLAKIAPSGMKDSPIADYALTLARKRGVPEDVIKAIQLKHGNNQGKMVHFLASEVQFVGERAFRFAKAIGGMKLLGVDIPGENINTISGLKGYIRKMGTQSGTRDLATQFGFDLSLQEDRDNFISEMGKIVDDPVWGPAARKAMAAAAQYDSIPEDISLAVINKRQEIKDGDPKNPDVILGKILTNGSVALAKAWGNGKRFVVYDLETTGLGNESDIMEIGATVVQDGKIMGTFHAFVKTDQDLTKSSEVTGITREMMDSGEINGVKVIKPKEALLRFRKFAEGGIMVGHNLRFDMDLLFENAKRSGVDLGAYEDWFDTLNIAKEYFGEEAYNELGGQEANLDALSEAFGLKGRKNTQHRADEDSMITAKVLITMADRILNKATDPNAPVKTEAPIPQQNTVKTRWEEEGEKQQSWIDRQKPILPEQKTEKDLVIEQQKAEAERKGMWGTIMSWLHENYADLPDKFNTEWRRLHRSISGNEVMLENAWDNLMKMVDDKDSPVDNAMVERLITYNPSSTLPQDIPQNILDNVNAIRKVLTEQITILKQFGIEGPKSLGEMFYQIRRDIRGAQVDPRGKPIAPDPEKIGEFLYAAKQNGFLTDPADSFKLVMDTIQGNGPFGTDIPYERLPDFVKDFITDAPDAMSQLYLGGRKIIRKAQTALAEKALLENQFLVSPIHKDGYVRLQSDKMNDYGMLDGKYVPKEVAAVLRKEQKARNDIVQGYRMIHSMFKQNKIIYSTTSYFNNFFGNKFLMQTSGIPLSYTMAQYPKAFREVVDWVRTGKLTPKLEEAIHNGLFGGTQTRTELELAMSTQEWDAIAKSKDINGINKKLFSLMSLMERKGEKLRTVYEGIEQIDRYIAYTYMTEHGANRSTQDGASLITPLKNMFYRNQVKLDPEQAVAEVNHILFDYRDLPKGVKLLRDTGIPFISFPYLSAKSMARNLVHNPRGVAMGIATAMMIREGVRKLFEKEIDMDKIFPWFSFWDPGFRSGARFSQSRIGSALSQFDFGGPMFLPAELITNKDMFLGEQIYDPKASASEKAWQMAKHAGAALGPNAIVAGARAVDSVLKRKESVADGRGTYAGKSIPEAVLSMIALKVRDAPNVVTNSEKGYTMGSGDRYWMNEEAKRYNDLADKADSAWVEKAYRRKAREIKGNIEFRQRTENQPFFIDMESVTDSW